MYPTGIDFIIAFYACMRISCISIPLYPIKNNNSVSRVFGIIQNSKSKFLLSSRKIINFQKKIIERSTSQNIMKDLNWIETDLEYINGNYTSIKLSNNLPELAYLQYTSGSTGNPKGVMVGHKNILHNVKMIAENSKTTEKSTSVIWLPH